MEYLFRLLVLLCFLLPSSVAAQEYITTGDDVIIVAGGPKYIAPNITVIACILETGDVRCYVRATPSSVGVGVNVIVGETTLTIEKTSLDGHFTGSGSNDREKFLDACLQAVQSVLEALNTGASFSITG